MASVLRCFGEYGLIPFIWTRADFTDHELHEQRRTMATKRIFPLSPPMREALCERNSELGGEFVQSNL